jgi:hypothetical protein
MPTQTFKTALSGIAAGIQDLSSLEVVTYKGKISIKKEATEDPPKKFNDIIKKAKSEGDFNIMACTYVAIDGDTQIFYDNEITEIERNAHHALVDIARQNRQAIVDLFKDVIVDLAK